MSFGIGIGDLLKVVDLAARIHKYGFSKASRAHGLYHEFGDNIRGLATNLGDLKKIVDYLGENNERVWDASYMSSLVDIIGDYWRTLRDCDAFLKDKERFSWQGDFVSNIVWNFSIASEVQTLKDRVAFLNIKLMTVLKTLDLRMASQLQINIFRIHQDLALRIDGLQEQVIQAEENILYHLRNPNVAPAEAPRPRYSSNNFVVPPSLQNLFQHQVQGSVFDTGLDQFPLVPGLDAIVYHIYIVSSITADSKELKRERQWLATAKAFWILSRVKAGRAYQDACSLRAINSLERQMNELGLTVASYVRRLEMELSEMVKGSELNALVPDDGMTFQLFKEYPEMWLPEREETGPTPTWELDYSENIMDASLRGPYRGFDQSLHLFRLTDTDLKLVITDTPKPAPGSSNSQAQKTNNIMNVDVRRCRFIPLYAATTSPVHGALNITFQGDRLASGSSALVFNKRTELFKFQHAITGYQVILESLNIGVTTYTASRMIGGSTREYTGRLQLWRAKKPQNSTTKENRGSSAVTFHSSNSAGSAQTILPVELPGSPTTPEVSVSPAAPSFLEAHYEQVPNSPRGSYYPQYPPSPQISVSSQAPYYPQSPNSSQVPFSPQDYGSSANSISPTRPQIPFSPQDYGNPSNSLRPNQPPNRASFLSTSSTTTQDRRRNSSVTEIDPRTILSRRRDSTWTVNSTSTSATANTAVSLAATGTTYTTTVVSADGTVGLILESPRPSLLVFLLQRRSRRGEVAYSTLGVEVDENTIIDASACKCRKNPDTCLRVVIQQAGSGAVLHSIRQDASDLEEWNLAAFRPEQRKTWEKEDSAGAKERLSWVAVDFGGIEEKNAFQKGFDSVKTILRRERAAYNLTRATLQRN